jgi:uncharacterized membrane protein
MKSNQELKNAALAALKGNWAPALVGAIVMVVLTSLFVSPAYCSNMAAFGMAPFMAINPVALKACSYTGPFINLLLLYPLMIGYTVAHNDLLTGADSRLTENTLRHTLQGYFRNVCTMFLVNLFTLLWALLLVIPGLIKAFAYSMAPFIIKDNPELSPNQAINLSVRMMKGHKFDLFWLLLSFIGWFFVCLLTLGIGFLWLMPYMQTALAAFYQEVKSDYQKKNIN